MIYWAESPNVLLAQTAYETSIKGQVINLTPNGAGVDSVKILVHQQDRSGVTTTISETRTDVTGRFHFDDVKHTLDSSYGISTTYQNAIYVLDIGPLIDIDEALILNVYDSSNDDSTLSTSLASVFLSKVDDSESTISALEVINIVNTSHHTFVPGSEVMSFLRFSLPPNTVNLQVQTLLPGAEFIQVDKGFALLASVPPGKHEIMYSYNFRFSGSETIFIKSLRYGADVLRILCPVGIMDLSGSGFDDMETKTIAGVNYNILEANTLPKGTEIMVRLADLPDIQSAALSQKFHQVRFEYLAPVALAILMATIISLTMWRRATNLQKNTVTNLGWENTTDETRRIRALLFQLGKKFNNGSLAYEDYKLRRGILENRLNSLDDVDILTKPQSKK